MRKFLLLSLIATIILVTALDVAIGGVKNLSIKEETKTRAVLQNHTSFGPAIITKAHIENITQIYGPFTSEDALFNKLIVYGPLDLSKSSVKEAFIYGPAKISNSRLEEFLTIFGPLHLKFCTVGTINITADKIFIKDSKITHLNILQDEHDRDREQILYLEGKVKIKTIEFQSGKGIIRLASKDTDLSQVQITGATIE